MKKKQQSKKDPKQEMLDKLPKDVQKKLVAIKEKLDKFKKEVTKKFDKYIAGISLLPPPKPKEGQKINDKEIHLLILVDDNDSKKMSKYELATKLEKIINKIAEDIDKNIKPRVLLLSELWQNCYDAKYDLLQLVAIAAPIYDQGMLAAVKIAELHKSMVRKRFEKYIVSYVLAGSLVQGKATKTSDIDVWIVIDDTDVKKMTRAELKDKLRSIIIGMGIEAGERTGIKNKLNIQIWLLTDFWDGIKEANPVFFTSLRYGVPFYDRGVFMPWKQLLKMGRIKPSTEAIDMYMNSGEQVLKRAKFKLREIGMEDMFWALTTPSQAALMLYGIPPPTPRETPEMMRELFVKKEKLLTNKDVDMFEKMLKVRKDIEHGKKKEITGKEVDELLANAEKYLQRLKKLFTQIEVKRQKENMVHMYDTTITIMRDALKVVNVLNVDEKDLKKTFKKELVTSNKIPARFMRSIETIFKAKDDFDAGKLTKTEIGNAQKAGREFIRHMIEFMQRSRGKSLDRAKIKVKHGETFGEILILEDTAFVNLDVDEKEKPLQKAKVDKNGALGILHESTDEEFEKALANVSVPKRVFVKEATFESLKKIFGKDVEILVHY